MEEKFKTVEREISFREVIWRYLKKWRLALVSAILFSVIFAGGKYIKDKRDADIIKEESVTTIEDVEQNLTDDEKKQIDKVRELQQELERKETYCENSVLMKIDPYNKKVAVLEYYVELTEVSSTSEEMYNSILGSVTEAYHSYIENKGIISDIGADEYEAELVSSGIIKDTGIFNVFVEGFDEKSVNELADKISKSLEKVQVNISETIESHTLVLLNRTITTTIDENLNSIQKNACEAIEQTENEIDEALSELNSQQLYVLEGELNTDRTLEQNEGFQAKIEIKNILIGIMFGLFIVFLYVLLEFAFGRYLKYADEIHDMFGIKVLGVIPDNKANKRKYFKNVDEEINRIKNHEVGTKEQLWELANTNLILTCKSLNKVYFSSSLQLENEDRELIDKLICNLKDNGIDSEFFPNAGKSAENYKKICELGNVIFIEKTNSSTYQELTRINEMYKVQGVKILGVIILDK